MFSFFWCLREMQKVILKDRPEDGHEPYPLAGENVMCKTFRELSLLQCSCAHHIDISDTRTQTVFNLIHVPCNKSIIKCLNLMCG